ncbi:MAG: sugar transferase [Patescibacteria group bacterium]|nr:MAG: sugar transferase [Patescibacteria group bacterium]
MKKQDLLLSVILLPVDFLMVVAAGLSAYYLRLSDISTELRPVIADLAFFNYLHIVLIIALAWLVIFSFAGLYNLREIGSLKSEFRKVVLGCSLGFVAVVIFIFFNRELFSSRFIVLAGWLLAIIYVSLGRALMTWLRRFLRSHGFGRYRVVIIGNSQTADRLVRQFSVKKNLGFTVVKRYDCFGSEEATDFEEFLRIQEVDEVIQADPNLSKADWLRLFDFADEHHIVFKYAADLLEAKSLRIQVDELEGIPIVEVKKTPLDGWGRVAKRLMDIIGSFFLIILVSPIMLLVALAIKLDSRGPVFFSELDDGSPLYRVGQGEKKFRYLKFRSMLVKTNSLRYTELADRNLRKDGPMVKIKDDPRVTRVGRFIRRFSLDELPELFLVFVGSMSLVGPRPHLPEEVAKYEGRHKKVLTIKPGITGLTQVSGRSDLSFEEEVRLDVYYIENWSILSDLFILLKTPWAVIRPRQTE